MNPNEDPTDWPSLAAWSVEWSVDRAWIERMLGAEWGDTWEFFGRMVNHLALEAAPAGDLDAFGANALRERIREQIPAGVADMTPFAVRQVWNAGLEGQARMALLERLRRVAALAGGTWATEELAARVNEIHG